MKVHTFCSYFCQKHVIAVVDGVTLVASVSLKVLQDGDAYSALLQVALRLHGRSPGGGFSVFMWCFLGSVMFFVLRCFGIYV